MCIRDSRRAVPTRTAPPVETEEEDCEEEDEDEEEVVGALRRREPRVGAEVEVALGEERCTGSMSAILKSPIAMKIRC
eukprot:6381558-Pyramimonas_sp.AAC.1